VLCEQRRSLYMGSCSQVNKYSSMATLWRLRGSLWWTEWHWDRSCSE